jgi:hypothetical protein
MFSVYCPGHGSQVLLGHRNIVRIVNGEDGIHLHWQCRCGTNGVLVTGRRRRTGAQLSA